MNQFIHSLVNEYNDAEITSWNKLDKRVKTFFTPERMGQTCSIVPNWNKMASYGDGVTLTHVMCVFLGMYMMPEFLEMTPEQQQMMKWVILFHDVEKEPRPGIRDFLHAFRSTVGTAMALPDIGFPTLPEYGPIFDEWRQFTLSAETTIDEPPNVVQDNAKLPTILDGIERMFGHNTPAALILKTILFHLSIDMNDWPPPNPLTQEEVIRYMDLELLPLLEVMHLGDGEGWSMFNQEVRERERLDTLQVFKNLEYLLLK
ncbi:MAG: hypothetical protein QM730_20465 [Anaerolineales bacterium]